MIPLDFSTVLSKPFHVGDVFVNARTLRHHFRINADVAAELVVHCRSETSYLVSPTGYLNQRLSTKRNENAESDDADFTKELTPAMHEFRTVEMHVLCPGQFRQRNTSYTVRNCTKSKMEARGAACIRWVYGQICCIGSRRSP